MARIRIDERAEPLPEFHGGKRVIANRSDPAETARLFIKDQATGKDGRVNLRKFNGLFFRRHVFPGSDKEMWLVAPLHEIVSAIFSYLDGVLVPKGRYGDFARFAPNTNAVQQVRHALLALLEPIPEKAQIDFNKHRNMRAGWR